MHHGIRDVSDAAQTRRFKRKFGGGNVNAHSANHDGHKFVAAQFEAEIINSFHRNPYFGG